MQRIFDGICCGHERPPHSKVRTRHLLLLRRLREHVVVVLLERGTYQRGGEPSEILSRNEPGKFLRIARQAEAPCCLQHLLVSIRKHFIPNELDLAEKDIGSDRADTA